MSPIYLILIFIIATLLGYFIIRKVPALLHTPLMSGMNALSGVTVIGALATTGLAITMSDPYWTRVVGFIAVVLAMVNVVGGFGVTHRMLKMFKSKENKKGGK